MRNIDSSMRIINNVWMSVCTEITERTEKMLAKKRARWSFEFSRNWILACSFHVHHAAIGIFFSHGSVSVSYLSIRTIHKHRFKRIQLKHVGWTHKILLLVCCVSANHFGEFVLIFFIVEIFFYAFCFFSLSLTRSPFNRNTQFVEFSSFYLAYPKIVDCYLSTLAPDNRTLSIRVSTVAWMDSVPFFVCHNHR